MVFQLPRQAPERYVELLNALQESFRSIAGFSIRRRIGEEQKGIAFSEEHATECAKAIRTMMLSYDHTRGDAHRFAREARRRLLREDSQTKRMHDEANEEEYIFNITMLLLTWHTVLLDAAVGEPMEMVLDVSDIGDDMLPRRLSSEQHSLIDENLAPTVITPAEFRGYLRALADASAHEGRLPTAMVELLSMDGVAVSARRVEE